MKNIKDIETTAEWLLDESVRLGASCADVLYSRGEGNSLSLQDGEVEECTMGASEAISIRSILSDGRQGIAYGNRLDRDSLKTLAEWSVRNAKNSEPQKGVFLYDGQIVSDPAIEVEDEKIALITPEDRMERCKELTERARQASGKIISVRAAGWHDGCGRSFYATTAGLAGWDGGRSAASQLVVLASDGENVEMGGYGTDALRLDEIDPEKIVRKAVEDAVGALGGCPCETGVYTAVIAPETGASLIDIIGGLFAATDVQKNRSMMKDKLGTSVASSCFTLTDDARIPWRPGSCAWDSEGVPTGKTVLIENGIAKSYLYNLQSAYKDGTKSTGNAVRGLSSIPDVGTSNLVVTPGTESGEALVSAVKKGVYLTEFMGLHTIDPISGDFSIGAKGKLIENGEFVRPVSGITIAGNLIDFIKNISAVGSDLQYIGSVAVPTIVAENIAIGGE